MAAATSKKKPPTVAQLSKRVEQLEKESQDHIDELLRRDAWIQLCMTVLLSLCRWAYAWCKIQKDSKRMANFKKLGETLNQAIEEIEPDF